MLIVMKLKQFDLETMEPVAAATAPGVAWRWNEPNFLARAEPEL